MKTGLRRFAQSIFAMMLIVSLAPFGSVAFAEEAQGLSKSKTSSEYELMEGSDTTEITLSLPSEEYLDTFDIVFVVDSSNASEPMEEAASDLMDVLIDEGLNANIGVIKFKGLPLDTINVESGGAYSGLTALSTDTRDYIDAAMQFNPDEDPDKRCGNGTNIHSALLLAEKWLDASDTPADHKYVLLFTDGRAYIYDDGKGNPTAIYSQYTKGGWGATRLQNSGAPTVGWACGQDKYNATLTGAGYYFIDETLDEQFRNSIVRFGTATTHSAKEFEELYNSNNEELTGSLSFETPCHYVTYVPKKGTYDCTVNGAAVSNRSSYLKSGASVYDKYYEVVLDTGSTNVGPYLELSPLEVEETADGYTYTGELNEDFWMFHVSSEEKALYRAAHTWTDLGGKYHTISVINDRGYQAGLETCADFLKWLPGKSELSADIKNDESIKQLFIELENQLIYAVGRAIVTDEIPSYLDLVEDAYSGIPFKLTVGGNALEPTAIADNDWAFGAVDGGVYPYEVIWNADSKTFTFNINVPVENANAVVLKYQLKWNGTGEEETDVDTNAMTTIEYWPSDNPQGESKTEEYVSPIVIYRATMDYTATKVWDDADDADHMRPASIQLQLYANNAAYGDPVTLDLSNFWTYTWHHLLKYIDNVLVDYEVKEVSVPSGYTAEVEEDPSGQKATVTNSHTPAPAKYKVTVKADPEKGGQVSGDGTFEKGATATVKAVAADGYTFVNWTEDGKEVSSDAEFSFEVTRDRALVAHFVAKPAPAKCKVIFDPNGGTINGKEDKVVIETTVGEVITILDAPTREGYTFKYWMGSEYYPGDKYTVPGDHTFVAQWQKNSPAAPSKTAATPKTGDGNSSLVLLLSVLGLISIAALALAIPKLRPGKEHRRRR